MKDINIAKFMTEASQIALICEKHSYADIDYCTDDKGNKCPFSAKGGCVFQKNWSILPCEILKRE